jgi:hypothetical protein
MTMEIKTVSLADADFSFLKHSERGIGELESAKAVFVKAFCGSGDMMRASASGRLKGHLLSTDTERRKLGEDVIKEISLSGNMEGRLAAMDLMHEICTFP